MWVYIEEFAQYVGKEVTLKGWVYNKRSSGKIHFLQLRDGTGIAQGVIEKGKVSDELFEKAKTLKIETSVEVVGIVREDVRSKGGYEMDVSELIIHQIPQTDYPIGKKDHGTEFLMENRHLWLRSNKQYHIMKVRNEIVKATRAFYDRRKFTLIDTPIFTGAIGEGAGNLFQLDYFDYGKAFLTQTGQLYLEAACTSFGKVYNLGPTFRAEKSKTRRHLTEFWMNEAEVAFFNHEDNMRLQEDLICAIIKSVLDNCSENLLALERDVSKLECVKTPFPRISYDEAIKMLESKGKAVQWGDDLGADDEATISQQFDRPVMVCKYPTKIKAFYMLPDPERPEVVLCDDMLAPEGYGEIIGASQRIDDYDMLVHRIEENGLPLDSYQWYLDLRKYGSVPHSGFGMGIERTVCWICGIHHIREAIPFARTLYRIQP
jgi:asparaginyl-tRNA synthetase